MCFLGTSPARARSTVADLDEVAARAQLRGNTCLRRCRGGDNHREMHRRPVLGVVFVLLLVSCGGRVNDVGPSDAGVEVGVPLDGFVDGGTREWDTRPNVPQDDAARGDVRDPADEFCPALAPVDGAACTPRKDSDFVECSYGNTVLSSCRTMAGCSSSGTWTVRDGCRVNRGCPAAVPMAGARCDDETLKPCAWADGTMCECTSGLETEPRWACYSPPASCPVFVPNAGSPCSNEGQECDYGNVRRCSWGTPVTCRGARWRWPANCTE